MQTIHPQTLPGPLRLGSWLASPDGTCLFPLGGGRIISKVAGLLYKPEGQRPRPVLQQPSIRIYLGGSTWDLRTLNAVQKN